MATDTLQFDANGQHFTLNLTVPSTGDDQTVSAISGTVGGAAITGLDSNYEGPDNTVYTTAPYVDLSGISFDVGSNAYNVSAPGNGDVLTDPTGTQYNATNVTFSTAACYCAGTRISTEHGEVPVERLNVGDRVFTASGHLRTIKWIGRRAYSARIVRNNPHLNPIRFKAGSLGPSTPTRDLCVSPKHAMFLLGMLIEAELLINDETIFSDTLTGDVHYFHVELQKHDVLIADGAHSESFVDDNNRGIFQNASTFSDAYPDSVPSPAVYCAPRLEKGDSRLAAVQRFVAANAFRVRKASAV